MKCLSHAVELISLILIVGSNNHIIYIKTLSSFRISLRISLAMVKVVLDSRIQQNRLHELQKQLWQIIIQWVLAALLSSFSPIETVTHLDLPQQLEPSKRPFQCLPPLLLDKHKTGGNQVSVAGTWVQYRGIDWEKAPHSWPRHYTLLGSWYCLYPYESLRSVADSGCALNSPHSMVLLEVLTNSTMPCCS